MFGGEGMSLQFITGRAGSGKTTFLIEQIKKRALENPHENQILIVPDQMTYQMERFLFKQTGFKGMMNIQVYSFSRVAWRVLQETGGLSRVFLTNSGMEMLVRQVVQEEAGELRLFGRASNKRGFYKELTTLFQEIKQYEVELAELKQQSEEANDFAMREKLADISLIYERYQEKLFGKFLENEDYLRLLIEKMDKSIYIQNASIYFDGFDTYSKQEVSVVSKFMEVAKQVQITLTTSKEAVAGQLNDFDMFELTRESLLQIREAANHLGVHEKSLLFLNDNKRLKHPDLAHLEAIWGQNKSAKFEGEIAGIRLHQANNRHSEIEGIAREVKRLVREENYHFSDCAILVRNMAEYEETISSVFGAHKLPYFWDKKRSMAKHPLIEFIRSSLDALKLNWQYETLFQAVRTEFFFPIEKDANLYRKKVDLFENYLLENGIFNRSRFMKSNKWTYLRIRGLETNIHTQTDSELEIEEQINEVRSLIQIPLVFLEDKLKTANTGKDYAESLFAYLEKINVAERIELWRARADEEGLLELSRQHEQAWHAVIGLLDEFVELLGDTVLSLDDFIEIIQTGLESMEFSLLPPSLDQSIVTDMEQARLLEEKIVFAIGLNDGTFPKKMANKGIISEDERESMANDGIALRTMGYKSLIQEEFIAYRIFTAASDRLYLSYPIADSEGKLLPASNYVRKIKTVFPALKEELYLSDPSLLSEKEQMGYITDEVSVLGFLTTQLQMYKQGYKIAPIWWDVYNFFIKSKNKLALQVLASLNYRNNTTSLSEETAAELFGDKIHASVSRMEKFFSCEFQHFAQYGLKLEERKTYQLQAVDMGEIFHGAMEWISIQLKERGLDWGSLSENDCQVLANQAMAYLAPKLQHEILLSSNRMAYIQYKLLAIILRATNVLNEQAKQSSFRPLGLEVDFGIGKSIPAMKIPLEKERELLLQGRIDRIDYASTDERNYLRIIDYKSSARDLQLPEIYYGLALQMLTYLDIVVTNAKKLVGSDADPAGVLYFHMHNKLVSTDNPLADEALAKELQKSFKMKGLILGDPLAVSLMDNSVKDGGASLIVPAEIKKDNTLSARSKTASKEDFEAMRHFVRHKYKEAGNKILNGEVTINPYHLKEVTPCNFCPFRSVCQFDPGSQSDKYRYLSSEKPEVMIQKMREEGGGSQ